LKIAKGLPRAFVEMLDEFKSIQWFDEMGVDQKKLGKQVYFRDRGFANSLAYALRRKMGLDKMPSIPERVVSHFRLK
jgi:hypothetical protein